MRKLNTKIVCWAVSAGLLMMPLLEAKNKKPKPAAPQDTIEVVGHIPLTDGPVTRFLATQHYSSHYLYAEHAGGSVTLLDVTKIAAPVVLSNVAYNSGQGSASLSVVAGTAALVETSTSTNVAPQNPAQTLRIMDFSDPSNPKVAREFTGVTAMSRDDRRGLIFVANAEGIWILQQHLAEDPEVEKEYERYVTYLR